jgi:4-hydroxybenzoate polyprenyltransferase
MLVISRYIKLIKPYIQIARLDHWVKHIFILPGIILGLVLPPTQLIYSTNASYLNILIGTVSAIFIASANYVINEWLDAEYDAYHPTKRNRPAPLGLLNSKWIYIEYMIFISIGILLALQISTSFLCLAILFALSGVIYNSAPLRLKDIPYLDVITEAFNNPLRLAMGWTMVTSTFPPVSLILAYWSAGAFLMAAKRLSELNEFSINNNRILAEFYRKSFYYYTTQSLTISCFVYALITTFGITVFLIKYRYEFILSIPIFILLFAYYLYAGMKPNSIAQKPEKLYKDKNIVIFTFLLAATFVLCSFVDMPIIEYLIKSKFIELT